MLREGKHNPHPVVDAIREMKGIHGDAVLIHSWQPVIDSLDGELPYEILTDVDAPPGYVFVRPDRRPQS